MVKKFLKLHRKRALLKANTSQSKPRKAIAWPAEDLHWGSTDNRQLEGC